MSISSIARKNVKIIIFIPALFIAIALITNAIASAANLCVDAYVEASSNKRTVIIDAGHGGEDCGAIGVNGVYEKDLNLNISFKLGEYLSEAGYDVIYTRNDDKLLYTEAENIKGMRKIYDLKNRIAIANEIENGLFISIHMNSYGSASASGLQVYYSQETEGSRKLASEIQKQVKESVQPENKRAIKSGENMYLLENSTNDAVLIECGFLSNPAECEKLLEKEYQKELCFAILCGIINYDKN
jgi:N-acetylmuramoyl-L-alanine amidase